MTVDSPALTVFESLGAYSDVDELIEVGQAEGQYLECKAPHEPRLDRGMRAKLAEAASGFANSGGGVILWGVSTDNHQASDLDVLTQIEPIGNVKRLAQQVDRALPGLTVPRLAIQPSRMLHRAKGDTKGLIVTYIPPTPGDPVQSTADKNFYFRNGDEFVEMPYEMVKRMFAGAAGPLLRPRLDARLVERAEDGTWNVPIVLSNESSAVARDTEVAVWVDNPEACASVTSGSGMKDASHVNPGRTVFMTSSGTSPIFRELDHLAGRLLVQMEKGRRPKRILHLRVQIFADRMRATEWSFKVQLAKTGFSIKDVVERFLY